MRIARINLDDVLFSRSMREGVAMKSRIFLSFTTAIGFVILLTDITTNNYYHLQKDSYINDQGFLAVAPSNDIDGQFRGLFGTTSMGADEAVDQIYLPFIRRQRGSDDGRWEKCFCSFSI